VVVILTIHWGVGNGFSTYQGRPIGQDQLYITELRPGIHGLWVVLPMQWPTMSSTCSFADEQASCYRAFVLSRHCECSCLSDMVQEFGTHCMAMESME
jgi:hypothetical protein